MSGSPGPIHSALDDDPAHAEAVDSFVVSLAEAVDGLQDTEARGDLRGLAERALALASAARRAGYSPLERAAEEVARAALETSAELAYKAVVELTDVARRVRQGHRGSL